MSDAPDQDCRYFRFSYFGASDRACLHPARERSKLNPACWILGPYPRCILSTFTETDATAYVGCDLREELGSFLDFLKGKQND